MLLSLDHHKTYTRHWCYEMPVARVIYGEKVKGQGHRVHSNFMSCKSRCYAPIWQICFILGASIVHNMTMCTNPFPGQNGKAHRSFEMKVTLVIRSFWRVRSLVSSLFGRIIYHMRYACNTWGDDDVSHIISGRNAKVHNVHFSLPIDSKFRKEHYNNIAIHCTVSNGKWLGFEI